VLVVADAARVDATGTRRRLRALVAAGWPNVTLAAEMGYPKAVFSCLLADGQGLVAAVTARRVQELFTRLQLATPPDIAALRRSRLRGCRHGWPPPLAWDEDSIDDPDTQPHVGGREDFADIVADHRYLGRDDREIARRLGLKLDTLQARLRRAGIPRSDLPGFPNCERRAS